MLIIDKLDVFYSNLCKTEVEHGLLKPIYRKKAYKRVYFTLKFMK